MSWSQSLNHNGVTKKQVESALDAIKAGGFFGGKWERQDWGWHSECDVSLHHGYIHFSGSWSMSGDTDLPQRFLKQAKVMRMPVSAALSRRA